MVLAGRATQLAIFYIQFASILSQLQKCCDEVLVTSSGPGKQYQSERLGVYKMLPNREFNDKPLYKKVDGDDYLYFWIFDEANNGQGHNWLISQDYKQDGHGIESPNMEFEARKCKANNRTDICPWTCVEHINGLRVPFSVWTRQHRLGGFYRDTTLRIQCWSTALDENCCNNIMISSKAIGQTVQSERLGKFTFQGKIKYGRKIYKNDSGSRSQYLYFWDWGANNGGNWMVGLDPRYNARGIESADLENSVYESICATTALAAGPFKVWDRLFDRWEVDKTLRLECYDPTVVCCPQLEIASTGSLRFYHPHALGKYSKVSEKNNRDVYKHIEQELFLHYNDFGIAEGTNWLVSESTNDTVGLLVTQNQEFAAGSKCATLAGNQGPFFIQTDFGWQVDATAYIKCQEEKAG